MIPQLKEWQQASGTWTCAFVDKISPDLDNYVLPARAMKMDLPTFASFVVKEFKPDVVYYNNVLGFAWKNQAQMRKYKNFMNAVFRKQNYII